MNGPMFSVAIKLELIAFSLYHCVFVCRLHECALCGSKVVPTAIYTLFTVVVCANVVGSCATVKARLSIYMCDK